MGRRREDWKLTTQKVGGKTKRGKSQIPRGKRRWSGERTPTRGQNPLLGVSVSLGYCNNNTMVWVA